MAKLAGGARQPDPCHRCAPADRPIPVPASHWTCVSDGDPAGGKGATGGSAAGIAARGYALGDAQLDLWHFPHVGHHKAFKPEYDNIKWRNNEDEFAKWCNGQTGYPIVDAGMRQLNATGYIHNRVRMIVGSFLCKDLLIDWRWGEAYFAEKLLDYDLAANNGGWQWVAGSGCDAAPYFRIFNPELQTKKFDPDLEYIKKWIPEFQEFNYSKQIVEHAEARERCLKAYKEALMNS